MKNKYSVITILFMSILTSTSAYSFTLGIYGNWCGPGLPTDGYQSAIKRNLKVIDEIDKSCKEHDRRYAECQNGSSNYNLCACKADLTLFNDIRKANVSTVKAKAYKKPMMSWFAVQGPTLCSVAIVEAAGDTLGMAAEVTDKHTRVKALGVQITIKKSWKPWEW